MRDEEQADRYWFARHSKSIIFLICVLTVVGVYEALTIPVAVFPTTNFPRIIIGVDNGVMPIEQMEVDDHAAARGSGAHRARARRRAVGHEPRLGRNRSLLRLDREHARNAAARRCRGVAGAEHAASDSRDPDASPRFLELSDHRLQPDVGHGSADRSLGARYLRDQAAAQPPARRRQRAGPGRSAARVSRGRGSGARCCAPRCRLPIWSPRSTGRT